tara:strand:- start:738 stop:2102 length:1365 start_codon:yes stop_codon:yes gene_type:complete
MSADPHSSPPGQQGPGHGNQPSEEILAVESRNLLALAAHYISLRLGWIFKTETVIMPAVMDAISGAGWLRGCLPVVNRVCSSLPPLFYAPQLKAARRKKTMLTLATLTMAVPFLILAGTWFVVWADPKASDGLPAWMPGLFLACYGIVFVGTGLQRLAWATVQGKLLRDNRRGRLLALSGLVGSVVSVAAVVVLLPRWLGREDHGFGQVFLVTAIGFIGAGVLALLVTEPLDPASTPPRRRPGELFLEAWELVRTNRRFRRITLVAMLFITIQLAFPHFQTLGRQLLTPRQQDQGNHLMHWVVAQNIGFGICTFLFGWAADFFGNRIVIRIQVLSLAAVPLVALAFSSGALDHGWYWATFSLLGLTPLTFRTINNYVLEIVPPGDHPRCIATLNLAMTLPFILSPAVGWLVDRVGFEPIFITVSALVATGGLLTLGMDEPRSDASGVATTTSPS